MAPFPDSVSPRSKACTMNKQASHISMYKSHKNHTNRQFTDPTEVGSSSFPVLDRTRRGPLFWGGRVSGFAVELTGAFLAIVDVGSCFLSDEMEENVTHPCPRPIASILSPRVRVGTFSGVENRMRTHVADGDAGLGERESLIFRRYNVVRREREVGETLSKESFCSCEPVRWRSGS